VEQHPEVVPVDSEIAANVVFIPFFEEYFAQQTTISFRHVLEDFANFVSHLPGGDGPQHVDGDGWKIFCSSSSSELSRDEAR
jgi:hypothetical protein